MRRRGDCPVHRRGPALVRSWRRSGAAGGRTGKGMARRKRTTRGEAEEQQEDEEDEENSRK